MAEWHVDAAALPALDRAMLLASWQRRKLWEADAQAMAMVKWLAEAVGGGGSAGKRGHSQPAGRKRVSGAAMMAMAGGELI